MSGRDMRNFVTNHRTEESEKLVLRVKDGLYSSKYKQVDYDKLKALAAEKKFSGQEKLVEVKKLQQVSKQSKEQNLLKQHNHVWKKEFNRLNSLRSHAQADVDEHIRRNSDSELLEHIYKEIEHYENKLDRDQAKFMEGTTTPVWELRDDLKVWVQEHKNQHKYADVVQSPEEVQQTVTQIKQQQQNILERLQHEQNILEEELNIGELPLISHLPPERKVQTGIPEEAFDLHCPNLELKASVLQEYILLDQKYIERMENLETQHSSAIESTNGGWSDRDHFVFLYVLEQYTHDIQNRRMLYIDRLKRHLPHMTRADIVAHEEWWLLYKYYHERRRDLVSDWMRDRRELSNKAEVVFAEATAAYEAAEAKEEHRRKQAELCEALYSKVCEWRDEKLEALRLTQQIDEQRHQAFLEKIKLEEEREKAKREKEKEKINAFHEELSAKERIRQERDKKRLEELKARHEEQAVYDKQRVNYRQVQTDKKEQSRKQAEEDRKAALEEKERILELIRQKVRPHVDGDLMRLWGDTESWQARLHPEEEFIEIQKPLFSVNTFTSNQITADPRFRMAEELHKAGLSQNNYARQVMATLQPIHPPRKDMESTVFK